MQSSRDGIYVHNGGAELNDLIRMCDILSCGTTTKIINVDGNIGGDYPGHGGLTNIYKDPLFKIKLGRVDGNMEVKNFYLTSLKNFPDTIGNCFDISNNKITSMVGGPSSVGGDYRARDNQIESIEGIPELVFGSLDLSNNKITSLVGIHNKLKFVKWLRLTRNPIEVGGIGLLLVPGIDTGIWAAGCGDFEQANEIIKKYYKNGMHGLLDCQQELIEAGLERYAVL